MLGYTSLRILTNVLQVLGTLLTLPIIYFGYYVWMNYNPNTICLSAANMYIAFSAAAIIIFLWSCLTTWCKNICCLVTFVTILYMVVVVQIAALVILIYNNNGIASNLTRPLEEAWEEAISHPGAMSIYENWFHCCGRESAMDYIINERLPPNSCFESNDAKNIARLYKKGCRVEYENYWMNFLLISNILGCVIVVIEMILSFVFCCLCKSIRNEKRLSC